MPREVAILGCGPAGLMAAHAVARAGHDPVIFSRKVRSSIFGAQFLHRPIPGTVASFHPFKIQVLKEGTREGYARKVYGDPAHDCSWDKFDEGVIEAWDLGSTYAQLWKMYEDMVTHIRVIGEGVINAIQANYEMVISTIPARNLCVAQDHHFDSIPIWVAHGPSDVHVEGWHDNWMLYNGRSTYLPYRSSIIRGYGSWEFTKSPGRDIERGMRLSQGLKPVPTDCNCRPRIIRAGRFGKWQPGVLTHHAFEEVEALAM